MSGPGPMQVVVPKLRYAELLLVDSSGQRVQDPSAQSHAEPGTGWEQLGRGWARIWGYEPSQRVAFRSPGGSLRWARVPLDGGLHVVELSPPRQVHVEFVGPPGLRYVECVSEHAPASRACLVPGPCICPDRGAVLRPAREREILARLDDDAERITLDWSAGLASVRGRWGGTEYFDVSVDQGARIAQRSKRIRIDDLYPGEHRIQIGDGNDLLWEGWVTLAPGEQLDLGNLSPDRGFIEGRVHTSADLSTSDLLAWTASWPLDEHGKFQVGPVSVDAEVGLWFTSADFAHQAHVLARPGDWVDIYVPEPESEGLDDHWLDDARLERPVDE